MPTNAARLDDQLCFALYSASNRLNAIYRPILDPLGLTYTQFVVMMALWENDGISITELAARTNLSKATMTPLLRKLEEKSLIQLDRMTDNDRTKTITVTPTGEELAAQSHSVTQQAFCTTGLTMDEAMEIIKICQRIGV